MHRNAHSHETAKVTIAEDGELADNIKNACGHSTLAYPDVDVMFRTPVKPTKTVSCEDELWTDDSGGCFSDELNSYELPATKRTRPNIPNKNSSRLEEMIRLPCWRTVLKFAFSQPYFENIGGLMEEWYYARKDRSSTEIYPPEKKVMASINECPFDLVSVVIIGQEPYAVSGQADGLAFSVCSGVAVPQQLQNIFAAVQRATGMCAGRTLGNLTGWAKQGVLLLNTVLTVVARKPKSHRSAGWENFTRQIVREVALRKKGVVFLLWGKQAQSFRLMIDGTKHRVITATYPSTRCADSRFVAKAGFAECNDYLAKNGRTPINWDE